MPAYRRVLLKLSGEALMGAGEFGIDSQVMAKLAAELGELLDAEVQVALVVGGGNIFRGAGLTAAGVDRVSGDHMGMLATVINALAIQDALIRGGHDARVMSAFSVAGMCKDFDRAQAVRHLEQGRAVIFAGGTGNPLFTTDSAAALRAIEIGADLMIKATKVNGVFSADPVEHPDAEHYPRLGYDEVIQRNLAVMDTTAVVLCRDHRMPLRVIDMTRGGALRRTIVEGADEGSLVE